MNASAHIITCFESNPGLAARKRSALLFACRFEMTVPDRPQQQPEVQKAQALALNSVGMSAPLETSKLYPEFAPSLIQDNGCSYVTISGWLISCTILTGRLVGLVHLVCHFDGRLAGLAHLMCHFDRMTGEIGTSRVPFWRKAGRVGASHVPF